MEKSEYTGTMPEWWIMKIWTWFLSFISFGLLYPLAICIWERWRAKNTIINGLQCEFDGSAVSLFGNCVIWWILTIITFGIFAFWIPVKLEKWIVANTHFRRLPGNGATPTNITISNNNTNT